MKYINELINFVKSNSNWKELLKKPPYSLKTLKECSWHKNWYMFVYNLFDSDLSNYIVRACRGTVLEIKDNDVKVISYPYSKFDNYGSSTCHDIEEMINWNRANFQLKCDGILIKTAKVGDRLYFFTNGSFDLNACIDGNFVVDEPATRKAEFLGDLLEYALKKQSSVNVNFNRETGEFYCTGDWVNNIPEGSTLMMELVSPRNKILVKYNETKLYWHGYRNENLIEVDPRDVSYLTPYETPELINAKDLSSLKEILATFNGLEKEGAVVVDYGTCPVARTKIKCDDYLRLKFARDTASNERVIFRSVIDGEYDDLMANVPATVPVIERMKSEIAEFKELIKGVKFIEGRRQDIFLDIKSKYGNTSAIIMHYYDGRDIMKDLDFISTKKKGYAQFKEYLICLKS